jgi:hypothetical protein
LVHTFFVVFSRAVGVVSDEVQGMVYSESKVETNAVALELEMDTAALELEMEMDVSQEISNQERYSAD